jgi:isopenicillin N synthase-like dioxygenase
MLSQTLDQEMAALPIIEFSKVARSDPGELAALLSAFKDGRFAYLDLSGAKTGHLWERAEEVMSLSSEFFNQALEDKLEYHIDKFDMSGSSGYVKLTSNSNSIDLVLTKVCSRYKPAGLNSGVIEGGKDGWEGLKV